MSSPVPKFVYKYHKINGYLHDLLENNKLWFSHQNDLNDPFDCRYSLSERYFNKLSRKSAKGMLDDLRTGEKAFENITVERFSEILLGNIKNSDFMSKFYGMLFGTLGWSVCCFTTNPMSELMWGHYGNSSKGICLEFEFSKSPEILDKLHPVKYDDNFPKIDSIDDLPEALLTKRTAWIDEQEWRVISNKGGGKSFNKKSLTTIYFGYYVTVEKIDFIRELMIKAGYLNVKFKQVNFYIDEARIDPDDLKPLT